MNKGGWKTVSRNWELNKIKKAVNNEQAIGKDNKFKVIVWIKIPQGKGQLSMDVKFKS